MLTRRKGSPLVALATLAVLVTGCGDDDSTGPGGGTLTEEGAIAVFGEIVAATLAAGEGPVGALVPTETGGLKAAFAPIPSAAVNLEIEVDEAVPCENGGNIRVDGSLEIDMDDNETGTYAYSYVQTPNNCVVVTEQGTSYRVGGKPNLTMAGSFALEEGEPVGLFEMSFTGGLQWTALNGGASGSCTIDVDYGLDFENMTGTAEGRICGYDVDEQL